MAASAWKVYHNAKKYILDGTIDLDTTVLVMKVVKGTGAAAVSDLAQDTFASCGTAVTFVGPVTFHALDNKTVTLIAGSQTIAFDAADEVFTASGNLTSLRYLVVGVNGGKALCYSKLSADTSLSAGSTLTVAFNAAGVFDISGGVT